MVTGQGCVAGAEDYIAHMASTHFPLSVQQLVETLQMQSSATAVHDATLSLAIISWDPEGRKIILMNPSVLSPGWQREGMGAGGGETRVEDAREMKRC